MPGFIVEPTVDADRQMRLKSMSQKRGKNTGLNMMVTQLIIFMIFQSCDLCLRVQNLHFRPKAQKFQTLVPAKNGQLKVL